MKTTTSQTKYEPVSGWAKLPMGVTFRGDATSIAVDSKDNVYVFNRGTEPIAVFDVGGNFFCLLYTSPSPRDRQKSRMPSSA